MEQKYSTIKQTMESDQMKREVKKDYRFFLNNNEKNNTYKHKDNTITQTKYNIITFLPKALLFQFFRLANVYFLIIAIIQLIPQISPLSPSTAIAPLAFVLCISLIREAIEDYNRYVFDKQLNTEPAVRYNNRWENINSGQLKIGELIIVTENNPFPADMIVLDSNLNDGQCYIETGTLDGEKNLKNKNAPKSTAGLFGNDNSNPDQKTWKEDFMIDGECYGAMPNMELYKFDGFVTMNFSDGKIKKELSFVLDAKQMLLKGALLRNTKWILGFALYTGHNTKIILNSKSSSIKYSRVETLMSKLLLFIFLLQFIFCVVCAICNSAYYSNYVVFANYLPPAIYNKTVDSALSYFTYMLLLNTMIPISLIISLEIAKLIQGYFISVDYRMFSYIREKFVKANSISLNEELGQVSYVFSDKTGTLTCNRLAFKYCVIGDSCYEYNKNMNNENGQSSSEDEERKKLRELKSIKEIGPRYFEPFSFNLAGKNPSKMFSDTYAQDRLKPNNRMLDLIGTDTGIISEYWKALVVAHECSIEEKDNTYLYRGLSPDDIELLSCAKEQGFVLVPGDNNKRTINNKDNKFTFEILRIMEFDSDRKRMSIIIRDGPDIKLFIKGADAQVLKRLNEKEGNKTHKEITKDYVNYFSEIGYRTLIVGVKIIDENEYLEFENRIKEAGKDLVNKAKNIEKIYDEMEQNIYILGATIVEDKLQDEVPETIRDLRLAKIKVWMLTGDKFNTAKNIGLSCNLISNDMKIFQIKSDENQTLTSFQESYIKEKDKMKANNTKYGVIVDGDALTMILNSEDSTNAFLHIAKDAESVICCRVSPNQKAEVVLAVKNYDTTSVTLSIGDGGNDVPMITQAHIGIGLHGEEGVRAVQASDYSMGEFKFLRRLLFFHGRINYARVSETIIYFFYKNFVFTINHFYFVFLSLASGQTLIDDWFISLYNLIFTAFPLGVRACADQDLRDEDGEVVKTLTPFIYLENRENPIFNIPQFGLGLLRGIVHGLLNFLIVYFSLLETIVDIEGNTADLWFMSVDIYTAIILIVSIRILIIQNYWTWINAVVMLITSWVLYIIFVAVVNVSTSYNSVGTMYVAFNSPKLYLNIILSVGSNFLIDLATYTLYIALSNSLTQTLRVTVRERGEFFTEAGAPELIIKYLALYKNMILESKPKKNENEVKIDTGNLQKHFISVAATNREKRPENLDMVKAIEPINKSTESKRSKTYRKGLIQLGEKEIL